MEDGVIYAANEKKGGEGWPSNWYNVPTFK